MRFSIRQKFKKCTASVVAAVLFVSVLPPNDYISIFESFAATSGSAGVATGPTQPGPGAGGMHANFLVEIENTVKNKPEIYDHDDFKITDPTTGTQTRASMVNIEVVENYRNKWPEFINSTNLESAAYFFKDGFSSYSGGKSMCLHINDSNPVGLVLESPSSGFEDGRGPMYNIGYGDAGKDYALNDQTWFQTFQMISLNSAGYQQAGFKWPATSESDAQKWVDAFMYKSLTPQPTYDSDGGPAEQYFPAYNAQIMLQYLAANYGANEGAFIYKITEQHDRFTRFNNPEYATSNSGGQTPRFSGDTALMEAIYMAAIVRYAEWQLQKELPSQRELLKQYIMNWNSDKADSFIVIADVGFAGQNDGDSMPQMYSYVGASTYNYGGVNTNFTLEKYNQMGEEIHASRVGQYGDDFQSAVTQLELADHAWIMAADKGGANVIGFYKWMAHYLNSWDIGKRTGTGKGILRYTEGGTKTYLLTPYAWESTVRNTDVNGRAIGMPGFGVLVCRASQDVPPPNHPPGDPGGPGGGPGGCPDPPCDPPDDDPDPDPVPGKYSGTITVKVDPNSKKLNVSEEQPCVENEQVTMNTTIKVTDITLVSQFLSQAVAKGGGAKIVVNLAADNIDHNSSDEPGDPSFFNEEGQVPAEFTVKKVNADQVTLETVQYKTMAELQTALNNTSKISYIDNQIKVCEMVLNRYYANGYICVMGGDIHKDFHFEPKGTEVTEDKVWAFDDARLYASLDPYYYSDMRHLPVSEIKANDPKNEPYEAMAGVPTTTDLYLGVGATEYMVNVDLKYRKEKGQRDWVFTVKNTECYGSNQACTFSCAGHEPGESCPGPAECGGPGCDGEHHANENHKGSCTYTWTIHQPIDEYAFLDITNAQLWLLDQFKYTGNSRLSDPYQHVFMPELGQYAFVTLDSDGTKDSAAEWQNGGGRLRFNVSLPDTDAEHWSNTKKEITGSAINSEHSACASSATNAINAVVSTLTDTYCTVISDYVVVETSEGYQNVMYFEQESQHESLASYTCDFTGTTGNSSPGFSDSHSDEVTSDGLHFDEVKTQEQMWDQNGDSSANWSSTHPTTTGYNGEYYSPSTKYDNSNSTSSSNIAKQNVTWNQPNLNKIEGNTDFQSNYNDRYIDTGYNIIDSTTPPPERKWSASDSIKPVTNGEWDTGHMRVQYKKTVEHNGTKGGKNFQKWVSPQEAPYSEEHKKINNIVIHNPISNRDATIISNDAEFDKRVYDSLDKVGTNIPDKSVCPNNESCQYSKLTCTIPSAVHVNSVCYVDSVVGKDCGMKPANIHVHTADCVNWQNVNRYYWEYRKSGCTYNGDTIVLTHSGTPTKQDMINSHGSGHSSCFASATFTFLYSETRREVTLPAGYTVYFKDGSGSYTLDQAATIRDDHTYVVVQHGSGCSYNGQIHLYDKTAGKCTCSHSNCIGAGNFMGEINLDRIGCTNKPNKHTHTSSCKDRVNRVLKCTDPHHHFAGEPWNYNSQKSHYAYADTRCYSPCGNDANHKQPDSISIPGMPPQQTAGNMFINLDREFKIYYPDIGDFEQQPNLLGIGETTEIRGKGYVNNCDTDTWLRNKFVMYMWHSVDEVGNLWMAGEYIDLLKLPGHVTSGINPDPAKIYVFDCVLGNNEAKDATVTFLSIANNAPEQYQFDESDGTQNTKRFSNYRAKHTVTKRQNVDVVGYIGALTLHDVGDPRFAELFKKVETNPNRVGWLIPNVVRAVDYKKPNKIVADNIDVRYENARTSGFWHCVYGITNNASLDGTPGGKAAEHEDLPLRPKYNPIPELRDEAMRPGYLSYFDIETVGNYYGENTYVDEATGIVKHLNRNSDGSQVSYDLMMQIKPKYYELNLDTKQYKKVDVYEYSNSTYKPVILWKGLKNPPESYDSDYYLYLDWLTEQDRRNYTGSEAEASRNVVAAFELTGNGNNGMTGESPDDVFYNSGEYKMQLPGNQRDPLGVKNALYLIDYDRTFIGSSKRYGVDYNLGNSLKGLAAGSRLDEADFAKQSQRWHFTLGLPSSSVFVYENEIPTEEKIKQMKSHNAVIVCAIEIKVRGEVWTLQYDGSAINRVDGNGFKITPNGPEYPPPPKDPNDPGPGPGNNPDPEDPVVIIYENKKTAADDIQTVGTH